MDGIEWGGAGMGEMDCDVEDGNFMNFVGSIGSNDVEVDVVDVGGMELDGMEVDGMGWDGSGTDRMELDVVCLFFLIVSP